MSLRVKILAIMSLPILVLIVATGGLLVSRNDSSAALAAERHTTALHTAFGQILIDLNDAEATMRGYVITHEPSYLSSFERDRTRLPNDLRAITKLVRTDRANAPGAAQLYDLANQRFGILQEMEVVAQTSTRRNLGPFSALLNSGRDVSDKITVLIDHEERIAQGELAAGERRLDANRHITFLIAMVGLPLGVLAALIVVILFMQRVVSRIRGAEEIARMLEEGMPLRAPSTSEDELGRLERVLVRSGTRVGELQSELRHMGTSDPLTRLMNRRGFVPTAEHQLEVAKRNNQCMALAFLDLDGLKAINDSRGHSAGDGMITEAAYVMRETFRASDLIGRVGGDEFCILFDTDSEAEARIALQRLQDAISHANSQEGRPFILSVSAGFAMFDPREPRTLDQLLAAADEEMYASKRAKAAAVSVTRPAARSISAGSSPISSVR